MDAFEREFAADVGSAHTSALSSGTAALHLAMRWLNLQPGDEVVCSSLTFSATVKPVLYKRAKPVFVDLLAPHSLGLFVKRVRISSWYCFSNTCMDFLKLALGKKAIDRFDRMA